MRKVYTEQSQQSQNCVILNQKREEMVLGRQTIFLAILNKATKDSSENEHHHAPLSRRTRKGLTRRLSKRVGLSQKITLLLERNIHRVGMRIERDKIEILRAF
jgi:hypothetical protein